MSEIPIAPISFAYAAQTADGRAMDGTIEAPHLDAAMRQLESIGLRVLQIDPADAIKPARARAKPLNGPDFLAFNEQLAQLTRAGLPIEHGLRLIAQDLKRGRLGQTIRAVADELERGVPIEDAIAKFHDKFPPLYAQLLAAGARTGDLSGMLLSIGRHVETVQKLRAAMWRAIAYPLTVTIGIGIVLLMLSRFVFPQFAQAYREMGFGVGKHMPFGFRWDDPAPSMQLPLVTDALFLFGAIVPWVIVALLALLIVWPMVWRMFRRAGLDGWLTDSILLRLPLIGRALKMNLLARWCATIHLAAHAGVDLPSALRLAGQTVHSPRLEHDSRALAETLERGGSLDQAADAMKIVPAIAPSMLELASRGGDLPVALETLSTMYQRQADVRVRALPMILTPILMIVLALTIAFIITGLLLPMLRLVNWLSGSSL